MSESDYINEFPEFTVLVYPCGLRAGDRVRLMKEIVETDDEDLETGRRSAAGEIWEVLAGHETDPHWVWLREPDGSFHAWDESIFQTFEKVDQLEH